MVSLIHTKLGSLKGVYTILGLLERGGELCEKYMFRTGRIFRI